MSANRMPETADPMAADVSPSPHEPPADRNDPMPAKTPDRIAAAADLTARWAEALATARAELDTAEAADATPASAPKIAARRLAARETVQIAEDTLAKAQAAELVARREAVAQQADTLARQVGAATEALAAKRAAWYAEQETFKARELEVQRDLREATAARDLLNRQQQALLLASQGQDVGSDILPPDQLPDSLQPGGILPAPAALAAKQATLDAAKATKVREDEQVQLDAAWAILAPIRIAALAAARQPGRVADEAPDPNPARYRATDAQLASLERAMAGEKHLSGEQREALATMARLVSHGYAEALAQDLLVEPAASAQPTYADLAAQQAARLLAA